MGFHYKTWINPLTFVPYYDIIGVQINKGATMKIFILLILSISLYAQTGYLQQTIKSTKNLICVYKYSNGLYASNLGRKNYCPKTMNLQILL